MPRLFLYLKVINSKLHGNCIWTNLNTYMCNLGIDTNTYTVALLNSALFIYLFLNSALKRVGEGEGK